MPNTEWDTAASGAWSDGADWSAGTYPDAPADNVTIGTPGAYTVSLEAGTSYEIGVLMVSDPDADLLLAGSLAMFGSLDNQGQILFDGGTINDLGTIYNAGLLSGFGEAVFFSLHNDGTISASSIDTVYVLSGYTGAVVDNTGVLTATGNVLAFTGVDLVNLEDGTLSGGTYIASDGDDFYGLIEWNGGNASTIATDDASITLGGHSEIGLYDSTLDEVIGIEQTMGSIGAAGTLALEQGKTYTSALSLSLTGLLVLDGGSFAAPGLVIAAGGTVLAQASSSGFDEISAPIQNNGLIAAAAGSVLFMDGAINGDVSVANGSTIEVFGGSISGSFSDNGFFVDRGGNFYVSTVSGAGTIALEQGATLFASNLGAAAVVFGGADAAIEMSSFAGTIANFGPTNSIVVTGRTGDTLSLNGDELQLMNGATAAGSLTIEGSLPAFSITSYAGNETITATPPLQTTTNPGPSYFNYSVSVYNPANAGGAGIATLVSALDDALSFYADDVYGLGTLTIGLTIAGAATTPNELADGGFVYGVPTGKTINGNIVLETPSVFELTTGQQYNAALPDLYINIPSSSLDTMISDAQATPLSGANFAVEVFEHELTHGFGFGSVLNASIGTYSGYMDVWDSYLSFASDGAVFFTGPAAEAVNGGPVAVTTLANGEAYSHWANSYADPNAHDLMSGLGITPGDTISALDLAALQDVGDPVVNPVQTACFAAGTRILTASGASLPVEDLQIGNELRLFSGGAAPIIWIGRRTLNIALHPRPETVQPISIGAGALGGGLPLRNLIVSPDHAMYLQGHLIPAKALLNGLTIRQLNRRRITYYHLELAEHAVVLAEGAPAESYLESGNRAAFENAGAAMLLHPDFAQRLREAKGCAPFVESGPVVEAVRQRVLDLAAIETTDDPALQIRFENGAATIESRAAIPGEISADPRDRRRLGVKIATLRIGGENVPLAHPALEEGWHCPEHDGRWTNGRAIIPKTLLQGAVSIEISLAATLRYPTRYSAPIGKRSSACRR